MPDDTRDTGIPTRTIHEAYLNMQQAHRKYRQARDDPSVPERPAHADYQDAVLTFYELIRPHLKRKSGVGKFWDGKLPKYPERPFGSVDAARQYYARNGIAVWELQKHVETRPQTGGAGAATATTDGSGSLKQFHEQLGFSDRQRLVSFEDRENVVVWIELRAVAGLKQLDRWDTREAKQRQQGSGFMAGESTTTVELRHVAVSKLTKAKRLLAEAADKMSLLSRIDIDHEDGAIVNFDQSRDGVEAEYRDAEYDSSPDI